MNLNRGERAIQFKVLKGVFLKWITIQTRGRVIRKFWRSLFVGTVNVYNAVYSRVCHKPVGKLWHVNKSASRALTSTVQTAFQETLNVHYERKDLEPVLRARQRRFIVFGTANDESWCRVSVWDYVFHMKNKKKEKNEKLARFEKSVIKVHNGLSNNILIPSKFFNQNFNKIISLGRSRRVFGDFDPITPRLFMISLKRCLKRFGVIKSTHFFI